MSVYVVVVDRNREYLEKRSKINLLILERGAQQAGEMSYQGRPYECYVVPDQTGSGLQARGRQAVIARGNTSCRIYADGQRMGNLYELVGV